MKITYPKKNAAIKVGEEIKRPDAASVLGEVGEGSPWGSSLWKEFDTCPTAHALRHKVGLVRDWSEDALDLGWMFHRGLEEYYTLQIREKCTKAEAFDAMWEVLSPYSTMPEYNESSDPKKEALWPQCERMLAAYYAHYCDLDDFEVLATEVTFEAHTPIRYSARLDTVIRDRANGGVWILEHKTARMVNDTTRAQYHMDRQVVGQVWLFNKFVDVDALGDHFAGAIVNITTKHKTPQFDRIRVTPSPELLHEFERLQRFEGDVLKLAEKHNYPKRLGNCAGVAQYFRECPYYQICHTRPGDTVWDVAEYEAPEGFRFKDDDNADS